MRRDRLFLLFCVLWLANAAWAQQCQVVNFLAVDNVLLGTEDAERPCYFIGHGNNMNAYVRADVFAAGLGATLSVEAQHLVFQREGSRAAIRFINSVPLGLQSRETALEVNGQFKASLLAIQADNQYYVPLDPVALAFNAVIEFDAGTRVIYVDFPRAPPAAQAAAPAATNGSNGSSGNGTSNNGASGNGASNGHTEALTPGSRPMPSEPRWGAHHDNGYTRIVLDLPSGVPYDVAVGQTQMLVTLPDLAGQHYYSRLEDPYLKGLTLYPIEGGMALRVEAGHRISATGQGFELNLIPASADYRHERLVIDLGPSKRTERLPASVMVDATPQEQAEQLAVLRPPQSSQVRYSVVLDPGHGGNDGGATGQVAGWNEKQVVLSVALKVRDILRSRGVEVIMTREGDVYPSFPDRVNVATPEHNAFISIHANGAQNRSARGIETFIFGQAIDNATLQQAIRENAAGDSLSAGEARTQEAQAAASSIIGDIFREERYRLSQDLARIVQGKMVGSTGWRDRGVKPGPFYVIRYPRTPAILVEVGFMTNPEEGRLLATEQYQAKLAQAIAEGILEFLSRGGQLSAR